MKTALITGASRGIGASIAKKLLQDGFKVYGTATSEAGAAAITEAIQASAQSISSAPSDPGQGLVLRLGEADTEQQVTDLIKSIGPVDVLVHNAGINIDNLMLRLKSNDWQKVLDVSLTSFYLLSKACVRGMIKNKHGRIVGISSVIGRLGNPGQCHYAAAKAGMEGMVRSLAWEVSARGVTVNTVAPGFIKTDMTDEMPEEQKNALLSRTATQSFGSPEDIANAVSFLCSDQSGFITGTTLPVNGGLLMY